jgi:hypothetical protein
MTARSSKVYNIEFTYVPTRSALTTVHTRQSSTTMISTERNTNPSTLSRMPITARSDSRQVMCVAFKESQLRPKSSSQALAASASKIWDKFRCPQPAIYRSWNASLVIDRSRPRPNFKHSSGLDPPSSLNGSWPSSIPCVVRVPQASALSESLSRWPEHSVDESSNSMV